MNSGPVEAGVALPHNKQCHPREGGDLPDKAPHFQNELGQAPHFQNEVPAFAGMTLPVVLLSL